MQTCESLSSHGREQGRGTLVRNAGPVHAPPAADSASRSVCMALPYVFCVCASGACAQLQRSGPVPAPHAAGTAAARWEEIDEAKARRLWWHGGRAQGLGAPAGALQVVRGVLQSLPIWARWLLLGGNALAVSGMLFAFAAYGPGRQLGRRITRRARASWVGQALRRAGLRVRMLGGWSKRSGGSPAALADRGGTLAVGAAGGGFRDD